MPRPDPEKKLIAAAMKLAKAQGWTALSMADVAKAAGVSLDVAYRHCPGKPAVLAALMRRIDQEVLKEEAPELESETPRDRLFDVVMRRFDALAPYQEGLWAVWRDIGADPAALVAIARPGLRSMAWMLEAAGISSEGIAGLIRVRGLGAIYAATFRVWLEDDLADQARTMAYLDRRLRQAEGIMNMVRDWRRGVQARNGPDSQGGASAGASYSGS